MVHTRCEAGGQQRFVRALGYQAADRLDFPWAGGAVIKSPYLGTKASWSDAPSREHQMRVEVSNIPTSIGGVESNQNAAPITVNKVSGDAVSQLSAGGLQEFVRKPNDQIAGHAGVHAGLGALGFVPHYLNVGGPGRGVRGHFHAGGKHTGFPGEIVGQSGALVGKSNARTVGGSSNSTVALGARHGAKAGVEYGDTSDRSIVFLRL